MHFNALKHAELFFKTYCSDPVISLRVADIGSLNVNGSMKDVITPSIKEYVGIDFEPGNGVDILITDPYKFPIPDESFDVVVTNSCFEHSEMFWLTFLEGLRILKPEGILYYNVPSAWMTYHRYPVDCWRFYPDSAKGLETWANYNNIPTMVLESYISFPTDHAECSDAVAVFLKNKHFEQVHPDRIVDNAEPYKDFYNAFRFPATERFPHGWDWPHYPGRQGVEHPSVLK